MCSVIFCPLSYVAEFMNGSIVKVYAALHDDSLKARKITACTQTILVRTKNAKVTEKGLQKSQKLLASQAGWFAADKSR